MNGMKHALLVYLRIRSVRSYIPFLASVIQILYFTLKRLKRPRFALEILNFPRVHIFFGQNCCTAHNLDPNTNSYINSASTRIQTSIKHQLIRTRMNSNTN